MSGYTKLFNSILASTVWELPATTKVVWITLLAMADKNGEVQASVPGLAKFAGVTREQCETALSSFLSPDPDSRTKDDEGRRLREIDGGWCLVNHEKYTRMMSEEDRRERAAERQRRYVSNRQQPSATVSGVSNDANDYTQTRRRQDEDETRSDTFLAPLGVPKYPAEFEAVWEGVGRRGDKEPALRAWRKRGKPTWAQIGPVWAAYMLSDSPSRGYVKDLSTWFNKGCHTQEWAPARISPGSAYEQTMNSFRGFLERHEGED